MKGGGYKDGYDKDGYRIEYTEDNTLYIWNPDTPCVVMMLDKPTKTAVLNSLEYNPSCSLDGNMKKGDGTRHMIKTAFTIAKEHGAEWVELDDRSNIWCEDGTKISLSSFSFLRNGKTWYEKQFKFQPKEEEHKQEYKVAKERLNTNDYQSLPCSFFTREKASKEVKKYCPNFYNFTWITKL